MAAVGSSLRAPARRGALVLAAALALVASGALRAQDELLAGPGVYRGVSAEAAVLYDGPSLQANRTYVVVRGTPLELVSELGRWRKVRDLDGGVFWIDAANLGPSHHVIVSRALASVRREASPVGELLYQAERGLLLQVIPGDAPGGWLRVRDATGTEGYVSAAEVWGRAGATGAGGGMPAPVGG